MIRKSRFIFTKERRTIRQMSGCLGCSNEQIFQVYLQMLGRIKDSWKWVHMYKGVGVRLFILSHLSQISYENVIIWSLRPNYFIFIGYLIAGNPLNPLWIRHCNALPITWKFMELTPVLTSRHLSYKTRGHVYSS